MMMIIGMSIIGILACYFLVYVLVKIHFELKPHPRIDRGVGLRLARNEVLSNLTQQNLGVPPEPGHFVSHPRAVKVPPELLEPSFRTRIRPPLRPLTPRVYAAILTCF